MIQAAPLDEMCWCPRCERGMPASRCRLVNLGPLSGDPARLCPTCDGVTRGVDVRPHRTLANCYTEALRYPVADGAPNAWLAFSVGVWFFWHLPLAGEGAAACVAITYLLTVVRHGARGHDGLPQPSDFVGWFDIVLPTLRALLAALPGAIPLGLVLTHGDRLPRALALLLTALTAAIALAWAPGALAWAALGDGLASALDPRAVLALATRAPRDYALTVGALWALVVAELLVAGLGLALVAHMDFLPVLPSLVATVAAMYLPLVMARIVGLLLRERAHALGVAA